MSQTVASKLYSYANEASLNVGVTRFITWAALLLIKCLHKSGLCSFARSTDSAVKDPYSRIGPHPKSGQLCFFEGKVGTRDTLVKTATRPG